MKKFSKFKRSMMESGDYSKNGESLKSQTSKDQLFVFMFVFLFTVYLSACTQPTARFKNYTETVNNLNIEMIAVQGGTFTMGCTPEQRDDCRDSEKPAHQVTVSDFYIGKYEVTQAQWTAVMGTTVRQQTIKNSPIMSIVGEGDNYPMVYVSWEEAQEFISRLNTLTGKQYRLLTEAEWEFAARGGNKSRGYKYSGSNTLENVAWYYENSNDDIHPVGTKSPNELGIYDMSGNVYEWCNDWYEDYSSNAQTDPRGPYSGSYRVFRGGCGSSVANNVLVSDRSGGTPDSRRSLLGFRLACSPNQEPPPTERTPATTTTVPTQFRKLHRNS